MSETVVTSGESKYVITIENFEGPLDLLWSLIKSAKLDVTEVPLALVTEQYIKFLRLMEQLNIQIASEFILMASELLYYKSKALLPGGEMEDEYFVQPLPPDLIEKLMEYKKYQAASAKLRERYELQSDCYARAVPAFEADGQDVYIEVSLFDLLKAFSEVMDSKAEIAQEEIVFDEILVSDRIAFIAGLLENSESVLFADIFRGSVTRPLVIASFLAILEMAKTGRIKIMQHTLFGDIRLFRAGTVRTA